jgi:hypothetical protein
VVIDQETRSRQIANAPVENRNRTLRQRSIFAEGSIAATEKNGPVPTFFSRSQRESTCR